MVIDFNTVGVPSNIIKIFTEALTCHANKCFVASAIMVRRTLEEICEEKGITEGTLQEKINALEKYIVLPKVLLESFTELRFLGNDATHVKAKYYSEIGPKEVEAAIEVTKEIIKGLYQLDTIVSKLTAVKNKKT